MQEMILILSRCQATRHSPRTKKTYYRFHFKGYYYGLKIKQVHVYSANSVDLIKGDDYLLWVQFKAVKESVLEVVLIKHKKIE